MAVDGSLTLYRTVMTYARRAGQQVDELQYVVQPEGLVAPMNGVGGAQAWEYRYFKTDHTGSTRVVLAASGAGLTAVQTTDYYPFGMAHGMFGNLDINRYLYGGKEYQDAILGGSALGLYDFHARYYDPVLGRWFNVDPALQLVNPYLYAGNNPLIYRDHNGQWFGIDDLIAGVVGGLFNAISGLITGDIQSVGHFFSSFGVGFAAGVATLYVGPVASGALMGMGNSVLSQGFNLGWDNINMGSVLGSGALGAVTAGVGTKVNGVVAPALNKVTSGISSPVLQQAVNGAATGAATGFVIGTGMSLATGENLGDALGAGGKNALFGATMGAAGGAVNGLNYAAENNLDPWTGEVKTPNNPVPDRVVRVVPADSKEPNLGLPNQDRVFVTAPEDIQGLDATQISNKLGIPLDPEVGFKIMEMPTPANGISTPIQYDNMLFRGNGLTIGGAREFMIPNGPIPYGPYRIVK